jgi:serine/threonine-protein kinase
MSTEVKPNLQLEIAHVLFIDLVGYSKLLIDDQREILGQLNEVIRGTPHFREAEAAGKLVSLPSGDGVGLVFLSNPEAPAECALEISKALQDYPHIQLRMGVHSGPVSTVTDVNERSIVAGAGINMAQRVMDCGDAGHILLSKRVAADLAEYRQWQPRLHDLGECEVKHGVVLSLVNLYTEELGNRAVPEKFKKCTEQAPPAAGPVPVADAKGKRIPWGAIAAGLLLIAALLAGFLIFSHRSVQQANAPAIPAPSAPAISAIPAKSIAVLPFDNLSDDKQNAYFTNGVQDEILTDLAKIADLKVISRTSVMQYKSGAQRNLPEIGQQLGVAHLLEGSVQRASGKVRVNAQLIDARTDGHLWAQVYDRPLDDVFAIQSEIAKAIADQLQAKLSPSERNAIAQPPTADVTAFDLYSRARPLIDSINLSADKKQKLLQAADLLTQALERDPSFFLAYCQLANTHDLLYHLANDRTPERLALAEAAIQAAFRLRPDAGEAHMARAEHLYRAYLDYDGALAELEVARRTLPNDPRVFELTGYILRRRGKHEDGLHNLQRALELDPRNLLIIQNIALGYKGMRRYSEEVVVLDRALAINPNDEGLKVLRGFVELDRKADTRPLHQTIESIRAENSAGIQSVADTWLICALAERDASAAENALVALGESTFGDDQVYFSRTFGEGLVARMMKEEAKARSAFTAARVQQETIVQAQPEYGPALCVLGLIDAGLGRKEEALREGRRAIELMPVTKNSWVGARMIEYFAIIAAWVGEKDLALEQLAIATRLPGFGASSYGQLKLLPYWDPLRGDPRFEKIVASLAPK